MPSSELENARHVLLTAIMYFQGNATGLVAARDPDGTAAENYQDCFIRDFSLSAPIFLAEGNYDIVKNFLVTVLDLHARRHADTGHRLVCGVMPASFSETVDGQGQKMLQADFGDNAIGRVTPVDSMMWWLILLGMYTRVSHDRELVRSPDFQKAIYQILELLLREGFEDFSTLLVPDGAFMIDRRMGVHGHPLEIQILLYAALKFGGTLLEPTADNEPLIKIAMTRQSALLNYLRIFYWLDLERLNEIHRFDTEEVGSSRANMLNIYPESIPDWVLEWLPDNAGFLLGNLGPGRIDFRFFSQGNLLAIIFGVTTSAQTRAIMHLYEKRWKDLIGAMPCKICFPALAGVDWALLTGSDPKNVPWSYHNGGNWPVLLQSFVAGAVQAGRPDLAKKAFALAGPRLLADQWPEYYDGRRGRLVGRRANRYQTWSAAAYLFSHKVLEQPDLLELFLPKDMQLGEKR